MKTKKIIKVQLVKSGIGRSQKQKDTLRGLGLTKLNKIVEVQDSPCMKGMIQKVAHLVQVLED